VARYPMSFQSDQGHCGVVHYDKIDDITGKFKYFKPFDSEKI